MAENRSDVEPQGEWLTKTAGLLEGSEWGLTRLPLGSWIQRWAELLPAASNRGPPGAYKHPQLGWPAPPGTHSWGQVLQASSSVLSAARLRSESPRGWERDAARRPWPHPPHFFFGYLSVSSSLPLSSPLSLALFLSPPFSFSSSLSFSLIKSLPSALRPSLPLLRFRSQTSQIKSPASHSTFGTLGR